MAVADDLTSVVAKGTSTAACMADDVTHATHVAATAGSPITVAFNIAGIAGSALGIGLSSYTLHKTIESWKTGNKSDMEKTIVSDILNMKMAFAVRSMVERRFEDATGGKQLLSLPLSAPTLVLHDAPLINATSNSF
jgi:hypothetical protein